MALHFGTTDIGRLDAGAYFLLSELKAVNYGARAGQTIVGALGRDSRGHWVRVGADGKPLARDSAALTREASQQGRALAQQSRQPKGKRAPKGRKWPKPKQTPEQRRQAREDQRAANRDAVFRQIKLDGDVQSSLLKLANGGQPDADVGGVVDAGLAVRDAQGQYRLTPQGRALFAAASAGDAGRARDALSLAGDRVAAAADRAAQAQTARDTAAARQTEREQRAAQRERERQQRRGGGSSSAGGAPSSAPRPSAEERQSERLYQVRDTMQAQGAGLAPAAFDALTMFAAGDEAADAGVLQALADETGLLDVADNGDFRLTTSGRSFLAASRRGSVRDALDALSRSVDKLAAAQAPTEDPMPPTTDTPAAAKMLGIDPDAHPGAMIAFLLDDATIQALVDACGDLAVDPDHLTLSYLAPDASQLTAQKNALIASLAELAGETPPLAGAINGYGRFTGDDAEGYPLYVNFDAPGLPELHGELCEALCDCDCESESTHGFTPHITLCYLDQATPMPNLQIPPIQVTFDRIALCWAGETITFPLLGTGEQEEDDDGEMDGMANLAQALGATLDGRALPLAAPTMQAPVGEIKMLADYRMRIKGVVYGGRDLEGDKFVKATDLGAERSFVGMPVFYDHAQRGIKSQIGKVVAFEYADDGIDFDIELDRHRKYARTVLALYENKALGGSSGALGHLVVREGGELKRWIMGELSLTPTAMEPRTHADLAPHLKAADLPHDTKSADAPETATETGRDQPVADGGALKTLVTGYLSLIEHDIKARLDHIGGTRNVG